MSFSSFNLSTPLNKAIADLGFENPTEIQSQTIPKLLNSQSDFVGQAQTGTGKTAAFLLPLLQRLQQKKSSDDVQALILTPTRELAHQVHEELNKLGKYLSLRSTTIYGGTSYDKQIKALKKDLAQIVVGTPGRVIDLINRKVLKLGSCHHLIIDEADEMLNMGFLEDVQFIMDSVSSDKNMWMFSATMPNPIVGLIRKKFSDPEVVKLENETMSNKNIDQYYCLLKKKDFIKGLMRIYQSVENCYGIVFCETRNETKLMADQLMSQGISADTLHGELGQSGRDLAMNNFRERKVDLLVCTDVAARGIDVSHVTHVFNMGLPRKNESYVHRIGRTGRAGLKGQSISFIAPTEKRNLRGLESHIGQKLAELKLPEGRQIKNQKVANELEKMEGLKKAIEERGNDFRVDSTFQSFSNYFSELSKEEVLKLLFSYQYNRDFRYIDENLNVEVPTPKRGPTSREKNSKKTKFRGKTSQRQKRA